MPTNFSAFFDLAPNADDFQKRIYTVIGDATTIVDCYFRIYQYIIGALKWTSRKARFDLMDNTVDVTGFTPFNDQQIKDAEQYFGEFTELDTAVLFEYLAMPQQNQATYGPNVYSLAFQPVNSARAAYRQVKLYQQILIYNDEFDRQDAYHQAHLFTTTAPPNGKITLNTSQPLNPDNANQINQLTTAVDQLEKWIKENYADLKAVANAKDTDLFPLVFNSGMLPDVQIIEAVQIMLEKIQCLADSSPESTHKTFGVWLIGQLEHNEGFWNNRKITAAYEAIIRLQKQFEKKPSQNLEIYEFFRTLFVDFLNPSRYEGESQDEAQTRRKTAFGHIKEIFVNFKAMADEVNNKYDAMMGNALAAIKNNYQNLYTANLLRARAPIPANPRNVRRLLDKYLTGRLKEKADECLRALPLRIGTSDIGFFIIPNYDDLVALNKKTVIITRADTIRSSVVIVADPEENKVKAYRPVYRTIRYSTETDEYIAFCNLENLAAGTFYYRVITEPAIVQVTGVKKLVGKILTIDFQNYTIDYTNKPDKTKNINGQPYRVGGSVQRFFAELKTTTKWNKISGVRRYDVYYTTSPTNAKTRIGHVMGLMAAGRGVIRTLPLGDESLCLWVWDCSIDTDRMAYPKLGELLGLPTTREIRPLNSGSRAQLDVEKKPQTMLIGGKQCTYVNYGAGTFRTNGFHYRIIGITKPKEDEEFYVQVNTPTGGVAATLTANRSQLYRASRPMEDNPQVILNRFAFRYFRRITSTKDKNTGKVTFTEDSKVIQVFRKGDKRKPSGPGTEVITWTDNEFDAIGTNLPICFNIADNIIRYFLDKQNRGKIINKGNALYRERKPRKDAGTAMRNLHALLRPPLSKAIKSGKMAATTFANSVMEYSQSPQEDWGLLKVNSRNYMPVQQEWCHLRGHGDGGEEYLGNFVSGSYHCNTEQLAVETGQRLVTQQMRERSFVLHTTAYLLRDAKNYKSSDPNEYQSQILTGNYLKNQLAYQTMFDLHTARRSDEIGTKKPKTPSGTMTVTVRPEQGDVAPVAAYLRYKVMRAETQKNTSKKRDRKEPVESRRKFFDFIFEGQSEFIDVNQSTIISRAVQFALAGADAFATWYQQEKAVLEKK